MTKQEALSNAIEKALKIQNESIVEILGPLDFITTLKEDGIVCHDDELENCVSGSFYVEVRQVMSNTKDTGMSAVHSVLGRFSDVSYCYVNEQHYFIVGSASIQ